MNAYPRENRGRKGAAYAYAVRGEKIAIARLQLYFGQ